MIEKITMRVQQLLLALVGNVGVFAFFAFVLAGFSPSQMFTWYREPVSLISSYVIIPWGAVLWVSRLMRAQQKRLVALDTSILALLLLWIIVPFALRFGITFNNVTSWHEYTVAYFGIYALLREQEPEYRARALDGLCILAAVFSLGLGIALLYCVATTQVFGMEFGPNGFGVYRGGLYAGLHYNITGMIALMLLMLCVTGAARRKHMLAKLAFVVPAVLMCLVVVLTQSRTARIAMLVGLAVSAYGAVCTRVKARALVRHGAGVACGLAVLIGGYAVAGQLTEAAVAHYNGEPAIVASAAAEETIQPTPAPVHLVRDEGEATFTGRTTIWKNLFALWRENPRYLLIGNGVGRTGSQIAQQMGAEAIAVHNTYLQYIADFGLIGFGLLCAFFVVILRPVHHAFFAQSGKGFAGAHGLGGLAVAALVTGLMESAPLGAMTPMNIMLCVALGVLAGEGWLVKER